MTQVCQSCNAKPATVHVTEIVNNNVETLDLCAQCAEEKGVEVHNPGNYGLGDLVAGLIDTTAETDAERIGRVRCDGCGYEYSDFKKIGRFGCPLCYDAFSAQLVPLLRHVHGSTQHHGKAPEAGDVVASRKQVAALRDALERAIASEDYEKAASIRDELRELEEDE